MNCPHCNTAYFANPKKTSVGFDSDHVWSATYEACPQCKEVIIRLQQELLVDNGDGPAYETVAEFQVYPRKSSRPQPPPEVPVDIARDYIEAGLVLDDSPQASAALSRRCLQHVLSERKVSSKRDLGAAIDDALSAHLPSHIAEDLDAIRHIGNFAAHPQKSANTGEILPVEPAEAEWNLDVLEQLFDFYYVQPARSRAKRMALNSKLEEAGKRERIKPVKRPAS